jgi:heme/copper-type cytochrome/quinol oxidase subunit 3
MDKNKLGMILFIASESIFFALLILAYALLHNAPQNGPTAANSLNPLVTGFFSLFLFSSSYTVWRAVKNRREGNRPRMLLWLGVTILFGIIFLSGQGLEWSLLIRSGTTISTNTFGTTFFTLTGFHGLHVIIGLVLLGLMLALSLPAQVKHPQANTVDTISLYWHFVDGVWVVIFSLVYLTILL